MTYTIEFWNDNRFAPGDISLVDDLDDYVRFLYAESNEYFELTVDEHDSTILRITNVKEIPAGVHVYEVFVCDFGGVPVGYTVRNTVGGNTTATTKISASLALSAVKTVDGAPPGDGEVFSFLLLDQQHRVLQTAVNDSAGTVTFQPIPYGVEDLGKTFTYYISESIPTGESAYVYDEGAYAVTATLGDAADAEGIVPISVSIEKNGAPEDSIAFNNVRPVVEKTSVCGSKTWDDADDQDGKRPESIVIDLFADDVFLDSRTVSAADGWAWAFEDLNKYDQDRLIVYSIREEPVPEYQSQVDGYNVTNRHVPLKISFR